MNRLTAPGLAAILACTAIATTPAPAHADSAMLGYLTWSIDAGDGGGLRGAYAACLLGGGDAEAAAAIWTEAGWTSERDDEMGVTYLTAPRGAPWMISMYAGGEICVVESGSIGTDAALAELIIVLGMSGFEMRDGECGAFGAGGAHVELTSSGQDPICFDGGSSAVRFDFGAQ